MNFVGFDPGGNGAFGWAVLKFHAEQLLLVATGTSSSAPEALAAAAEADPCEPSAFATDAPLFWVQSGDRKADAFVRKMVCAAGGKGGTVSHVNSLQGACLVQGIVVSRLAAAMWPNAAISEAHPKALLAVCGAAREFAQGIAAKFVTEHERDAALAAYVAYAFVSQSIGWHDLTKSEQNPFFPGGKQVAYWFPKART